MGILRTLCLDVRTAFGAPSRACSAATVAARRIGHPTCLFCPELRHTGCPTGRRATGATAGVTPPEGFEVVLHVDALKPGEVRSHRRRHGDLRCECRRQLPRSLQHLPPRGRSAR